MAFINMEAVPLYFSCNINSRETIVNSLFWWLNLHVLKSKRWNAIHPTSLMHKLSFMYNISLTSHRKYTVYIVHTHWITWDTCAFKTSTPELTGNWLLWQMFILSALVYFRQAMNIYQLKLLTEHFLNERRVLPRVPHTTPLLLCASTEELDNFK